MVFGIIALIAVIIFFPYLTYASFSTLAQAQDFGFGEWASAFWLMLVFGGAAAAAR